eukprot:TRINITY_DN43149_c0_g1_i1.p1 TRINITY_DN43149_c0_g1~~TRINITY_DN43149_c0_g1_i1.p1  ORF type:complete len:2028 (+),score=334.88 TRINITY_DN43149_c0_g1_i1:78-6161(+)
MPGGSAVEFITGAPSLASAVSRIFAVYSKSPHLGQLCTIDGGGKVARFRSYAESGAEAAHFAAGLAAPPLSLPRRATVAISLPNCPEWLIADFACALNDFVVVGLHPEWPDATIQAVLVDAGVVACITTNAVADRVAGLKFAGSAPSVQCLVITNAGTDTQFLRPAEPASDDGLIKSGYEEVVARGMCARQTHTGFGFGAVDVETPNAIGQDGDVFTLLYSSGTSGGPPKATAVPKSVWRETNCTPGPFASMSSPSDRRAVSYMALAHGADRGVAWSVTVAGGCVGFVAAPEGSARFEEELVAFRPTFMLGMSYFWQDRYTEHLERLRPAIDSVLAARLGADRAAKLQVGEPELWASLRTAFLKTRQGQSLEQSFLAQARAYFGGSLLLAATGGAATPAPVLKFMASCVSEGNEERILDVYGSTEFPGVATNGEVGPDVELKLLDVRAPDGRLLYSPSDLPAPRGEVAVRLRDKNGSYGTRPWQRTSYWKRPELDAAAWDEDGFCRMGDVGLLDYTDCTSGGAPRLKIIDRVTSLEEVYWRGDSAWIEASALEEHVFGVLAEIRSVVLATDRNREGVVAIVVPSDGYIGSWVSRSRALVGESGAVGCDGLGSSDDLVEALRARQRVHPRGSQAAADAVPPALEAELMSILRAAVEDRIDTKPYEVPVACVIDLSPWSEEVTLGCTEGLLTMTGKPRRGAIKHTYVEAVWARYGRAAYLAEADRGSLCETPVTQVDAAALVLRAHSLLTALHTVASEEVHARSQHEIAQKIGAPLPERKRGSRVCDTSFVDATGAHVAEALTPLSRDWLAGQQAFSFDLVRDVDAAGCLKDDAVPASSLPPPDSDASTDINVAISVGTFDQQDGELLSEEPVSGELENRRWLRQRVAAIGSNNMASFKSCEFETLSRLRRRVAAALEMKPHDLLLCVASNSAVGTTSGLTSGERFAGLSDNISEAVSNGFVCLESDSRTLGELCHGRGSSLQLVADVVATSSGPFYALESGQQRHLNGALEEVRRLGLEIRDRAGCWQKETEAQRDVARTALRCAVKIADAEAAAALHSFAAAADANIGLLAPSLRSLLETYKPGTESFALSVSSNPLSADEAPLLATTRGIIQALVHGKQVVLARTQELQSLVDGPPERADAMQRLTGAIEHLRAVGDECDVDVRSLPITWTMDLNWAVPPRGRATCPCIVPGCALIVYQDQVIEHMESGCNPEVGVASPADAEAGSVQMGGSTAAVCDVSSVEIDSESIELPSPPGGELPWREGLRYHSIDSGLNRRPEMHEALRFMHETLAKAVIANIPGATAASARLKVYDPHHGEIWVKDKQEIFWLHKHVLAGKDLGRYDTPASLVLRACDAFAERPCLGIPGASLLADEALPRRTPRTSLADAALPGLVSSQKLGDSFLWLRYSDLGLLVRRVAAGLLTIAPSRSLVAIAGYNDFEWVVADFAVAVAGMATVSVHTTYDIEAAAVVLDMARPAVVCACLDLLGPAGSRSPRWDVASLLGGKHGGFLASLHTVIGTDTTGDVVRSTLDLVSDSAIKVSSFPEMVADAASVMTTALPDPFDARGAEYLAADGSVHDLGMILFTSGSSGKPKAVATGVSGFVHDITGDPTEAAAFSTAVTVSYIPLSHSSDRYKVWQHVVYGGRVGLCYFAAANWEAHEKDKKAGMIEYSSSIDELFRQVAALRPTNMACPPNIWAGLNDWYEAERFRRKDATAAPTVGGSCSRDDDVAALDAVVSLFGGRLKTAATGGSPTPASVLAFAKRLCSRASATFVESYGTTESGAIAADGRQLGPKFAEVEVRLVDRPEFGFTSADKPLPRGEVVVKSSSLCLGYYNDAEAEAAAFVVVDPPAKPCPEWVKPELGPGRWYFTQDLASRDASGRLTLLDRVGAVVVIGTGQVVRLGELEVSFEGFKSVQHCFCHASPQHRGIAAIVVFTRDSNHADHDDGNGELGALPASEEQLDCLRADGDAWARLQKVLGGAELRVGIADSAWTVGNGLLSGELKKRRGELLRTYSGALEALLAAA